jgi:hypothetical protein
MEVGGAGEAEGAAAAGGDALSVLHTQTQNHQGGQAHQTTPIHNQGLRMQTKQCNA